MHVPRSGEQDEEIIVLPRYASDLVVSIASSSQNTSSNGDGGNTLGTDCSFIPLLPSLLKLPCRARRRVQHAGATSPVLDEPRSGGRSCKSRSLILVPISASESTYCKVFLVTIAPPGFNTQSPSTQSV